MPYATYTTVAVKPLSAERERVWALQSDRPGLEFCVKSLN